MSDKPEALKLAYELESDGIAMNAADELRRLHLENEENEGVIKVWRRRTQQAEAQRDELLAALELLVSYTQACEGLLNASPAAQVLKARAAIAKVTGETS